MVGVPPRGPLYETLLGREADAYERWHREVPKKILLLKR